MQEIALVTMKDITKDRSMRYDEALDGQVNKTNISTIINIPHIKFISHIKLSNLICRTQ